MFSWEPLSLTELTLGMMGMKVFGLFVFYLEGSVIIFLDSTRDM